MKKRIINLVVLAMAGLLLATGCGKANDDILGADWRTTGMYVPGTLYHKDTVDVYVGVKEDKVAFFYDLEIQEPYNKVTLTYPTTDVEKTRNSIELIDLNGDGYTDLSVKVYDQQGEEMLTKYTWDQSRMEFIFVEPENEPLTGIGSDDSDDDKTEGQTSDADAGDFSMMNFIGSWLMEKENLVIVVDNAYNWAGLTNGEITVKGTCEADYGKVVFHTSEGVYYCTLVFNKKDRSVVDEYGGVYAYAGPVQEYIPEGEINMSDNGTDSDWDPFAPGSFSVMNFYGGWSFDNGVIVIDSLHNWAGLTDGQITVKGTINPENGTVVLYTSEGTHYSSLLYSDTEKTVTDEAGNKYEFAGPVAVYFPEGVIE